MFAASAYKIQGLLVHDLVAQESDYAYPVLVKQRKMPFCQQHGDGHFCSPDLVILVISVEAVSFRSVLWRDWLSRVWNQRGRLDHAVARLQFIIGSCRKVETSIVDAGTGQPRKCFRRTQDLEIAFVVSLEI